MKTRILGLTLAMTAIAATAGNYKVTLPTTDDDEGAMAYLVDYDNGAKIDSVLVEDGVAVFVGEIESPVIARITVDGARKAMFFLEPAEITIDVQNRTAVGGELNTRFNNFQSRIASLVKQYQAAENDSLRAEIQAEYYKLSDDELMANIDNPFGLMIFMESAYNFAPAELEEFVANHPSLKKSVRVSKLLEANKRKMSTSEGQKFADFEIEYEGTKHRLSDVVGKGDYVLVDFWASWCGPCIRQTEVLKGIYKDYKDKGLKILGVAVWDEPENTKDAIERHQLPWESWLNGGNIPTDIYGISGIPCIILFGPDGTILSRDKQSEELVADIAKYMNAAK